MRRCGACGGLLQDAHANRRFCEPCVRERRRSQDLSRRRNEPRLRTGVDWDRVVTCAECHVSRPASEMHPDGRRRSGISDICKACMATRYRERHRDDKRRYRATDPEAVRKAYRRWQLAKTYGMTPEQYDEMFASQGGVCAICGADWPQWRKDWHIDHCHESGQVRGILCHKCNLMIGLAGDSPETLLAAARYLGLVA